MAFNSADNAIRTEKRKTNGEKRKTNGNHQQFSQLQMTYLITIQQLKPFGKVFSFDFLFYL